MDKNQYPFERVCAKCGKIFCPAPYHQFKDNRSNWYCKPTCWLHRNDKKKEEKENDGDYKD